MSGSAGFFVAAALPAACVLLIYAAGARRRAETGRPLAPLRVSAFWSGLALLLVSVEWPFEAWAHKLFFVHQIGIMVARIVAPMLIALSRPAGPLVAGLPRRIRTSLLKPGLIAPTRRRLWRVLTQPAVVTVLYIGALYLWELPILQDAALSNELLGYTMHLSLLLTGLLFWTCIFERRPMPLGFSHGARLMMIWLAMLAQILLGAYITVKTTVLFPGYGLERHMGLMSPIVDESAGGFFIWVPSGLISLLALIGVIHLWGLHETRMDEKRRRWSPSNSAILLYPTTAKALREMTKDKNRRLAMSMTGFVLLVFSAMIGFVGGAHRMHRRENMRQYLLSRS